MRTFCFSLEYYKDSGKYYCEGEIYLPVTAIDSGGPEFIPTMFEAVTEIRRMQGMGTLPGLQPGTWEGPIRLSCKQGFPVLLMPE